MNISHLLWTPACPATRMKRDSNKQRNNLVTWDGSSQPPISEDNSHLILKKHHIYIHINKFMIVFMTVSVTCTALSSVAT